jgi:hypothetical protein
MIKSINVETAAWIDLQISPVELRPCHTLSNGQSFSWKKLSAHDNIWIGVLAKYPLAIKQTPSSVSYLCLLDDHDPLVSDDIHHTIMTYFQLDICLSDLYQLVSFSPPTATIPCNHPYQSDSLLIPLLSPVTF